MFKEFSEFPNVEENDYDIKSSLRYSSNDPNTIEQDIELEEDIFEDYNIENTLKMHNYNYKELIRSLIFGIDYDKLTEILNECNITLEEFSHPDAEIFETLRNYIINWKHKQK